MHVCVCVCVCVLRSVVGSSGLMRTLSFLIGLDSEQGEKNTNSDRELQSGTVQGHLFTRPPQR